MKYIAPHSEEHLHLGCSSRPSVTSKRPQVQIHPDLIIIIVFWANIVDLTNIHAADHSLQDKVKTEINTLESYALNLATWASLVLSELGSSYFH